MTASAQRSPAKGLGLRAEPIAHRHAANPAPSASTLIRFMTRVPVRAMGQLSLMANPSEENRCDFFARSEAPHLVVVQERKRFQWLSRSVQQAKY